MHQREASQPQPAGAAARTILSPDGRTAVILSQQRSLYVKDAGCLSYGHIGYDHGIMTMVISEAGHENHGSRVLQGKMSRRDGRSSGQARDGGNHQAWKAGGQARPD